jgi:DUF4097 and DUF4098 domain-containing protein YvlB
MNTHIPIILSISLILTACAPGPIISDPIAIDMNGVTGIEAHAFNGTIRVLHGQTPSLKSTKRGAVEVLAVRSGGVMVISGRRLQTVCVFCGVDLELVIPNAVNLNLETSNGSVDVTGVSNALIAKTSNAAISTHGTGEANLTLETNNGAIRIEQVQGAVRASTSNAPITLDQVIIPKATVNSLSTSNGALEVTGLSTQGGMQVSGGTSNGRIDVTLPGFDVQQRKGSFSASRAGSDTATLHLETSNGGITIRP